VFPPPLTLLCPNMSDIHPSQVPAEEVPDINALIEPKEGAITPPGENQSLLDDGAATPFSAPNAPFMTNNRHSVSSYVHSDRSAANSVLQPSSSANPLNPYRETKDGGQPERAYFVATPKPRRRRFLLSGILILILLVLAVVLGIFFGVVRHASKAASNSSKPASSKPTPLQSPPLSTGAVVYGGDGTVVTADDGSTFVYNNSFGGYFVEDPNDPFNNNARAQSWSPPLNQTWQWGTDIVRG
jgi:hypothetical protein